MRWRRTGDSMTSRTSQLAAPCAIPSKRNEARLPFPPAECPGPAAIERQSESTRNHLITTRSTKILGEPSLKSNNHRIALLIDCDNVSSNAIESVLAELAKHGTVNVRHAHGDWKSSYLSGWAEKLHPNAVRPIQQFAYSTGKNATDSAMIIDAMDLLYGKNIDAFALMTSDSDFTPLVLRILESGMPVFGFGERKTPTPFVHACSEFIYIENLQNVQDAKKSGPEPLRVAAIVDKKLIQLLRTAVDQTSEDDGWSHLSKVGKYVSNTSSFSPLNYGFRKLSDLLRSVDLFEIEMRSENTAMYVRPRDRLDV